MAFSVPGLDQIGGWMPIRLYNWAENRDGEPTEGLLEAATTHAAFGDS